MMDIAGVEGFDLQGLTRSEGRELQEELEKDDFLRLLITQLEHQDPLDPMDNTQFVSQMAQFSSLEQMQNLNSSMSEFIKFQRLSDASSLIGRTVEFDADSGEEGDKITGLVEGVSIRDGEVYLITGEEKYPVDAVRRVLGAGGPEQPDEG